MRRGIVIVLWVGVVLLAGYAVYVVANGAHPWIFVGTVAGPILFAIVTTRNLLHPKERKETPYDSM